MITMFNNNLKSCRENLDMTQSEFGYIFGVHKQTVSGWENSNDIMPFNKLVKFSNLYGYSLDYILGFTRSNKRYGCCDISLIGSNLKILRKYLGISQKKLADDCGIAQTTYSGYELGHYLINTNTICAICKVYNVSCDWLVGRSNDMFLKNK